MSGSLAVMTDVRPSAFGDRVDPLRELKISLGERMPRVMGSDAELDPLPGDVDVRVVRDLLGLATT